MPGQARVLGEKLRYAHGEDHVRDAVAVAGLTLQSIDHAAIRTEGGNPVPALIVVAAVVADVGPSARCPDPGTA